MSDFSKAVAERRGWTREQWDEAPPLITAEGFPPYPGESRRDYVERLKRGRRSLPTLRQFLLAWAFAVVLAMLVMAAIEGRW